MQRICCILNDGETGSLRLKKGEQEVTLFFQGGQISAATTNSGHLRLGRFLAGRMNVDTAAVDRLLRESRRRHMQLGHAAVARNLVDAGELEDVIREQVVRTLVHALSNDFQIRSFTQCAESFFMPAQLDSRRLLLELARACPRAVALEPSHRIALSNGKGCSGLPWHPQELSVLNELQRPRTFQELAAATGFDYKCLARTLCVLDSLHMLSITREAPCEVTAIVKRESFPFDSLTPEIRKTGLSDKMEMLHNESSFISEQFRTLKVRISERARTRQLKVIAVSSSQAADGKSMISANLAASFSQDPGRRVILVDCDMRNPSLHKFFGTSAAPGLLGYLAGDRLPPYCYMRRIGRLYFLTAGGLAASPIELLSHNRMRQLIDYLKAEFDTILLDCPPFMPIADAQILTALSDGFIMVVRCGKTTYTCLEKAFLNLDRNKLLGVVLNDVKPMKYNTQYDHRYYHYKNRSLYPYGNHKTLTRRKI